MESGMSATGLVNVGVVGLGRAGWDLHARVIESLPDRYRVAAACDTSVDRLLEAQARLGCRTYVTYEDMLCDDGVELVVLATPSHLHAEQAIAALRAGKHVLVEKPFATGLAAARAMVSVARETGLTLTGAQNSRYFADFRKVREVIASGVLGRVLQVRINWHYFRRRWDWQTLKEYGGGSLNNDGAHAIDLALILMGEVEPTEIYCHREHTPLSSGNADDHVKIVLRAPGVPLIDLEFSAAVAYPQDQWLIVGTQGGLVGGASELRWRYFDPRVLPARPVLRTPTPDRSWNREEIRWTEEHAVVSRDYRDCGRRLYADLYAALREGAPLAITPEAMLRRMSVMAKCRELSPV